MNATYDPSYTPTEEDIEAYNQDQAKMEKESSNTPRAYAPDEYRYGFTLREIMTPNALTLGEGLCTEACSRLKIDKPELRASHTKASDNNLWVTVLFFDTKPSIARKIASELVRAGYRVTGDKKSNLKYRYLYSEWSTIPTGTACEINIRLTENK